MATITLIAALFSLGLTLAVLWINPHRFSNQAFALAALVQTAWLWCVYRAIQAGASALVSRSDELEFWFRANATVASLIPTCVWLIMTSIIDKSEMRCSAVLKIWPILAITTVLVALCYTDSFVTQDSPFLLSRGFTYYTFMLIGVGVYILCIIRIIREICDHSGIRRVELQFLALNAGGAALLVGALNAIGNYLNYRPLNRFGIFLLLAASALTAWALLFHRVFNAREVLLHLYRRSTFIVITCGGTYVLWSLIHTHIAEPFGMLVSLGVCGSAAVWLDQSFRDWFDSGSRRKLDLMRRAAIEVASTEVHTDKLVLRFERLLQTESGTPNCTLLFDVGEDYAGSKLTLPQSRPGFDALLESGWTTPESLSRRQKTGARADLQNWVEMHSIGLIITTPRESPNPSLIITFGRRADESPFTYPEVERLQMLAALLDNLLARSRRVAHTALQARLEYLAVASRGLAHDLKNLITPVSSFLVHTDGLFARDSSAGEVHAAAQRSTHVMSDYVRENLFFSEKLTPRYEQFNVGALLEQAREVSSASAGIRNVGIEVTDTCREHFVADRVLLQRMLVNLVSNAIDASTPGDSVTVSARDIRPRWIRIEVTDRGSGITPENLARIFDPYFTTKEFGDELRGFGLGLTIAQKIIVLHNGRISASSRPGEGTTFSIELPNAHEEILSAATDSNESGHIQFSSPTPVMS